MVARAEFARHNPPRHQRRTRHANACPLFALTCLLIAGCTPYIPVRDEFSTSALKPTGTIPPEFAEFNNYNPQVDPLLADQICATPYERQVLKSAEAAPGEIVDATGRCQTYATALSKFAQPFNP